MIANFPIRIIAFVLALLALPVPGSTAEKPLTVGWTEIAPLFRADENGGAAGFGAEAIRAIAERADLTLSFRRFDTAEEMIKAQAAGEVDLLPAIAAVPFLGERNVFSDPIAETFMRVFVRAEDARKLDPQTMAGLRIGIPSVPLGPGGDALLSRIQPVEVPVGAHGIAELLRGKIDGLISAESVAISAAYELRLDHRIIPVGAPIMRFDRVVTLNKAHAELLGPINSAIAALERDGVLEEMRMRNLITAPPPAPAVLTVGVAPSAPYAMIGADGQATGFAVEALRQLAQRLSLTLRFIEISAEDAAYGPSPGRYDLLPMVKITPDLRERMDVTAALRREYFSIFALAGQTGEPQRLDLAEVSRIGVDDPEVAAELASRAPGAQITVYGDARKMFDALTAGAIDGFVGATNRTDAALKAAGLGERVQNVAPSVMVREQGIALRFGLGDLRERLNAALPAFLASAEHDALRREWFQPPVFWTQRRINLLIVGVLAIGLVLVLLTEGLALYRRRQALRERRRFAAELVDELPFGVLLVAEDGTIEFANAQVKRLTPGGDAAFQAGRNYRSGIEMLLDGEAYSLVTTTREDMLQKLTVDGFKDGFHSEFQLTNGDIFVRSTRVLSNGSRLMLRQDVTEERRRLQEIKDLNQALERQVAIAAEANDELRAFAYATSHDLKAPTNTALMLIAALKESLSDPASDEAAELTEDLQATTERMAALIEDVLDYTNAIGAEISTSAVDLGALAAEVLENLRADIEQSGAVIDIAPLPSVQANAAQMRQLLQNLIGNAVKFRQPSQPPRIRIAPKPVGEGFVGFSVADQGIGIAPEHLPTIFQLFTRLNDGAAYHGSGLGLAICQRVARNHGGEIAVTSTLGSGTEFTVSLKGGGDDQEFDVDRRQRARPEAVSAAH